MASIFVVIAESGDVCDYTTRNICAYTDHTIADKVCEVLNLMAIARRKFLREDLRGFVKKWHTSHPSPLAPKQERFGEVYPELPAELAALPKEERKGPEYEKYLQAIVDYQTKLEVFKIALSKTESEAHAAYEEWETAYDAAIEEFKSKFDMMSFVPEELTEQVTACLPYADEADSFLVDEIDLLS